MKLSIDFDGVLHDDKNVDAGHKMGKPIKDAVVALQGLKKRGHTIIIFTARMTSGDSRKHIADWLNYFKIPFDKITNIKESSDYYIDDKAIHFDNWQHVVKEIMK